MFCECRYYYRYRPLCLAKLRKNENAAHCFWGILTSGYLYKVQKRRRMAVRVAQRSGLAEVGENRNPSAWLTEAKLKNKKLKHGFRQLLFWRTLLPAGFFLVCPAAFILSSTNK
jgi:hypothetical protein